MVSKWLITYILINGVHWGYNPLTNLFINFLGHPSRWFQRFLECLPPSERKSFQCGGDILQTERQRRSNIVKLLLWEVISNMFLCLPLLGENTLLLAQPCAIQFLWEMARKC